ncbi:kinetochore scaffold 1 [Bufo gargarizans]|uniref:kinetochore scaffold 1 n=1 Tax=Bufo gargarizans TaxID=30331 RepID=UPI001CF3EE77|nr:kinetochore scaffold 1 [Bufo gargarizans]
MDGKSASQNSELTERGHHRRLSSILKVPRSPLKDLGCGNELCQEPVLEKRRKSSRRVSFAETIRVFTPELQIAGSADKENEGFGAGDSCNSIHKGTADNCEIAGMDTLLHGPIHAPGHNVDWNYMNGVKDRTIFFSSDNDMDMTASNTVAIHGLIEEKTLKIDTSQFLASLKSHTSEEVEKNQDFQLSFGVEKHSGFQRDSSMENKIKFSDFLSSLGSGKSKATNCLDDADKENIFPFVPIHLPSQDNTGNVTQMFREQDHGLDLTKCHTTNIDSFFPAFNKEIPTRLIATDHYGNSQPKSSLVNSSALNTNLNRPPCNDQTVFMEDDMDITCSHTTRIRQDIPAHEVQLHRNQNKTLLPSDKTIIFVEENEMELTKNNSVWLNRNQSVTSSQRKERAFGMEHTTILPQGEDMDITKSHTVAIDGLTIDRVKPQAMSQSMVCNMIANDINGTACVGVKRGSGTIPNKSLNSVEHAQSSSENDATYASDLEYKQGDPFSQARQVGQNKTLSSISNLEPLGKMSTHNTKSVNSEKTVMFAYEQADMELTKSHTIAIDGKRLQDNKSYFSGLKLPSVCDKTILFSTDGDDMELTQSHTVCIDQKALNRGSKKMVFSEFQQRGTSVSGQAEKTDMELSDSRRTENTSLLNKATGGTKRKSILNATSHVSDDIVETGNFRKSSPSGECEDNKTVLFTCDQQDMEITRSHMVSIDSLKNNMNNRKSNDLGFNLAVSTKCPGINIHKCKEQDGYTIANEQEAGTKSSYGLPASGLIPAQSTSSEESTREACATLQNNTIFFRPDQGDMDITYSSTVAIKNTLCGTSKSNKSLLCVPATLKNIAADKTVFEDEMELTKSHTMIIDERDPIGLHDRSTLVKDVTFSSALNISGTKSISHEVDTTLKVSKQQLHNETVHQDGDMEMTNVNAGLLVAAGKSHTWNKGNPLFLESCKDKTIYLCDQDDMDMTRAHTVSIENKVVVEMDNAHLKSGSPNHSTISPPSVDMSRISRHQAISRPHSVHCFDEKFDLSRTQFNQDMDITVSNTVCIDNLNDLQLAVSPTKVLPSSSTHHLDYMERDQANDLVFDKKNGTQLEKDAPVSIETQDKTVFLSEQNDMDITRSHTTAIESKMLECTKARKVITANRNSEINMADDAKSMICSNDEDMDITKSNTVFIDQISNKLSNKGVQDPKRKSLSSHPKRLGASNETILLVCNMEETNANVNLTEKLINMSCFDKTVCNQGDMEITKSHTVAIENKTSDPSHTPYPVQMCSEVSRRTASCDQGTTYVCGEMEKPRPQAASTDRTHAESVPLLISKSISCKDLHDAKATTMTLSVNGKERELTNLQGNSVLTQRTKDLLHNGYETVFPDEEKSLDVTRAHTATVEIHFLDHNSHIPSTRVGGIKDDIEVVGSLKACGKLIGMEQKCDNLNECLEQQSKSGRNNYARSLSLLEKSGIEGLENELTQSHTVPVEDVSVLKAGPCGNAGTGLMLDTSDHKTKEHTSFRNDTLNDIDLKRNHIFPDHLDSHYKKESLTENMVPDDKSSYGNGAKSHLLGRKSESLKMTGELIPVSRTFNCDSSSLASDSRDHVRPKEQTTHVLPEDVNHKDPEVELETQVTKAKLKGKRVSFHFPEKEIVAKDVLLDQENVMPQENRNQVVHKDGTVHVTDQISDFNSDFINQTSVIGMMKTDENLEDNLQKDPERSKLNPGLPKEVSFSVEGSGALSELSENPKNKRRSIGDIQLKIKSLTQKSKMSSHHTAPVSSLIEPMQAPSQIVCSSSETEQFLMNAELQNTELFEEKHSRENSLPNRFSVKMIKPKLPNKRASSTSIKNQEPVLSSVPQAQPQKVQSSKALLRALSVADDSPCIDEEILPDVHEISSIFHYEVPEGAWEDLCQDEALQQNSKKRALDTEDDLVSQIEKKSRRNEDISEKDNAQTSAAFKCPDKSYRRDYSAHHASKTMEQTCSSSSSQDSRGDGMSVELSSQQYSQMDSQLPWDAGCEQSLWQKFQDGTITVQEFFGLLRIRILIQKPRYSELPSKHGMTEELTAAKILRDQYVYQPTLPVYEEESRTLYQTIEELKVSTELQHKPLAQVNSLLWEAMRMCSENELMYFGVPLKNMKSLYSKKSKLLAHEEKVSTYSKLLHTAQIQCEQLQARLSETDGLLRELDDCISSLETENVN